MRCFNMSKTIVLTVVAFLVFNLVFVSKVLADDRTMLTYDNNEVLKIVNKVIPQLDNSAGFPKLRTEDLSILKITQDQLNGIKTGLRSTDSLKVSKNCPTNLKSIVSSSFPSISLGIYISFTQNNIPLTSGYIASIVIRAVSLLCPGESTLYTYSSMVITKSSLYTTLSIILSTYTGVNTLFLSSQPVTIFIPLYNVLMGSSGTVAWFGKNTANTDITSKFRYILR